MDTEPFVFVGIDWASTEHQVCLTGTGDPVQRPLRMTLAGSAPWLIGCAHRLDTRVRPPSRSRRRMGRLLRR